jgi:hypothetical protein
LLAADGSLLLILKMLDPLWLELRTLPGVNYRACSVVCDSLQARKFWF